MARDDTARGMRAILGILAENAKGLGDDYPGSVWQDILASVGPESAGEIRIRCGSLKLSCGIRSTASASRSDCVAS